jgi:predicted metal-dependent hydrolase
MIHLIEPTHNKNFFKLLTTHYPNWQTAKAELNQLPLVAETWD